MEFVTPPALDPGSRVAVCAPAAVPEGGRYPDHLVDLGLDRLRDVFDLDPVAYPSVDWTQAYRHAHPDERAAELEAAFRDPDVDGVVAAIGGNDQVRVLRHLDPAVVREHPTRFYGHSDNTSFQAFLREQGVVSYYGGTLFTDVCEPGEVNEYTREYLDRTFFEESLGEVRKATSFSDQHRDWNDPENLERTLEYEPTTGRSWHGTGRVTGRTWGGCLEVLGTHFVADRCLPDDTAGSVLLLETSEEQPAAAEVRRLLTGMGERGALDVGAVLVGRAKARSLHDDRPSDERAAYRERQRTAVRQVVDEYAPDAILVTDVEFGHTKPVAPLPIGGRVDVDADERTIRCPS